MKLVKQSLNDQSVENIENVVNRVNQKDEFISLKDEVENIRSKNRISSQTLALMNKHNEMFLQKTIQRGKQMSTNLEKQGIEQNQNRIEQIDQLDEKIDEPVIKSLLNPLGEIEVEDNIYRVTDYGTFTSPVSKKDELEKFINDLDNNKLDLENEIKNVDGVENVYKVNGKDILYADTFDQLNPNKSLANTLPVYTIPDFPVKPNIYTNVDMYEFNDAKTWAGKALQEFFGRTHYKQFPVNPKTRLKTNFYSRNWLLFTSVGCNAQIQIRGWTGLYRQIQNFDELRLEWSNIAIKINVPALGDPNVKTPNRDFWGTSSKALQSSINFNFGADGKKYLVYRIQDIVDFGRINYNFPYNLQEALNKLISKMENQEIDAAKMLEAGLDRFVIDQLVQYVKKYAEDKTSEPAFINTIPPVHGGLIQVFIPGGYKQKINEKGAWLSHTFDFETLQVKWSNTNGFGIKPTTSNFHLISGQVFALGKLDGRWVGIGVFKKKD